VRLTRLLLATLLGAALGSAASHAAQDKPAAKDKDAPASAAPAGGGASRPEVKRFKDWALTCTTPKDGKDKRCYIFQNLLLKKGGQRLLNVVVGHLGAEGKPAAILTLPLGISLPPGASIRVDEGEPVRFAIERCTTQGCAGGVEIDEQLLAALKRGKQAKVSFRDAARREIVVPVSLSGFTAAYNRLP